MAEQLDLFSTEPAPETLPDGFRYQPEVITPEAEQELLGAIRSLPFKEFEFHGYVGKRRTVSFGASYDFATERLAGADPIPEFLLGLRAAAARFSGVPAERLVQALVTEYGVGAAIGWHRDKGVFGEVVGISLLSAAPFRLRRETSRGWERVTIEAAPRSGYLLSGSARTEWEHSIPEVDALRYSVTFRTLAAAARS